MAKIRTQQCSACDLVYDTMEQSRGWSRHGGSIDGARWAMEHPLTELVGTLPDGTSAEELINSGALDCCPRCDSREREIRPPVVNALGVDGPMGQGRSFPYFDRGLGCWVNTPAHHKAVMREMGVLECGGENVVEMQERIESREDDEEDAFQAELDEQLADPEVRRAMDLLARVREGSGQDGVRELTTAQASPLYEESQGTSVQQTAPDPAVVRVPLPGLNEGAA